MEQPQSETEKKAFEHSVENTRLESQPNALLEHVKAQVLEQAKARLERRESSKPQTGFPCKS